MENPNIPAQFLAPSAEVQSPEDLGIITTLAKQLISLDERIEQQEAELEKLKAQRKQVAETDIPDRMTMLGLQSITIDTGHSLKVEPFYQASIKRTGEDGPYDPRAFDWLEENGHSGVIKSEISVPMKKGQVELARELVELLTSRGVTATFERSVHAQTLKALTRELAERGDTLPEDYFKVYTGRQAKIKAPRFKI